MKIADHNEVKVSEWNQIRKKKLIFKKIQIV